MDIFGLAFVIVGIVIFFIWVAKRDIERLDRMRNEL
jgi:hypothetical protein